jgi:2-oxoglutarate ferredoxin oxidoreductase subunit alpha
MRLNILVGGKAGQGINKVSGILSEILVKQGYFVFNYRDYPSVIRGSHNFNVLAISDKRIGSNESKLDGIVALDEETISVHKKELKKDGFVINSEEFIKFGRNLNISLAGALAGILGIDRKVLIKEIKRVLDNEESIKAAEGGFESQRRKFNLKKLNNKIVLMSGSEAVAQGAINSGIDLYAAYPMTPATSVLHELAMKQEKYGHMVFQPENEIAVVNCALGASFAGARTMVGTSGGGYDLMCEGLSLQGQSEVPLVVYLASRPGPATGVPTYTMQGDLDIALRGGHGEFPRIVVAPGDPIEAVEKINEAFFLSEKFNVLSIVLSDKHLAESQFSLDREPDKAMPINVKRKVPGEGIVRASSYEHDEFGNTIESAEITEKNAAARNEKYRRIKKEVERFEMIKIYGKKDSKNLIIGWGSTKPSILDAIEGLDYKFIHVLYIKPLSDKIKEEMEKAKKVILVEGNVTGQLGRLIREKTGIKIENKILKTDGRPFLSDKLREEIQKIR